MNYDAPTSDRITDLHDEAEHLAGLAKFTTDPNYAAELRARADRKVRQAARLREESGL